MHNELFADAFSPKTFRVLGLRLETYTIAHELALIKLRNPLLFYHTASFSELPMAEQARAVAEAAMVCCAYAPRPRRLWAWLHRRADILAEAAAFFTYRLAAIQDLPTVKMPRTPGVPYHYFGSPELARLINYISAHHRLLVDCHYKGSPLNFPLGLARMLYTSHLESEGAVWVENHLDAESKQRRDLYDKLNPEGTFAYGEEAVQKMAEKWNADHPDCPVPLPRAPKQEANHG